MKKLNKYILPLVLSLWAAVSCQYDEYQSIMMPFTEEDRLRTVTFTADVVNPLPDVRSILPEEYIETLFTGITVASYDGNGIITAVRHYPGKPDVMELNVNTTSPSNIYALVNMGDMSSAFPVLEKDLQNLEYRVEDYGKLTDMGFPMCGLLAGFPADAASGTIVLERLFAKVRLRILHTGMANPYGYTGFVYNLCNKSIYMRQANSVLSPFRLEGSRAEESEDIMSVSDYNSDMNDRMAYEGSLDQFQLGPGPGYCLDSTFVFYVPENVQGCLLPDNLDPFGKDEEGISDIDGYDYSGLCTYIEFNARREHTQGYSGDLTYRYYLGSDNITDFSVERNRVYDVMLNFSEEGLFLDSWKVTRGDDWVDNRVLCFRKSEYHFAPGSTGKVVVHYSRENSVEADSMLYPDDWELSYDEETAAYLGLECSLDKMSLHLCEDGYQDFVMTVQVSENAELRSFLPVMIRTFDGSIVDRTIVRVMNILEE